VTQGAVLSDTLDDELERVLASDPTIMGQAPRVWKRLLDEAPVHRHGPLLILSQHAPMKPILRDRDRFVTGGLESTQNQNTLAGVPEDQLPLFHELMAFQQLIMSRTPDIDRHDRLRRVAHRAFTPRRIEEARDSVVRYTEELLDEVAGDDVSDLMELAFRLPLMVIADMLGVPHSDYMKVHHWCSALATGIGGSDFGDLEDRVASVRAFREYLTEIVDRHRADPSSVSPLVASMLDAEQGETLSIDELVAMFANLSFAGHETTANLISIGLVELLGQREQWERLAADPSLAMSATEELLRYVTPVQFIPRTAAEPLTVAGVDVERGQTILLLLAAANRDPAVFADPDSIDITRAEAGDHVAFGFGPRYCLGVALARLEGAVVFETLATRFPKMTLATEELEWHGVAMLRRLRRVPVRLEG
jgi:cytochrome P450